MCLGPPVLWSLLLVGCASSEDFRRVEQPPEGIQISELASATSTRLHRSQVSGRFEAPVAVVWDAAVRVVPKLERLGELPRSTYDRRKGRIEVRETHSTRQDAPEAAAEDMAFRGWKDDFVIEVKQASDTETTVTVHRTVLGIPGFRACRFHQLCNRRGYEPEVSNGQIEDWFLTQVEDELKKR